MGWTSNGSPAGSVGKGAAIQGIQVMLVEKGCSAPGDTANHFIGATDVLSGSSYGLNGNSLGTVQGKTILMGSESGSEPLTSLSISFDNQETSGSIGYSGCYEFSGWSGVVSDGAALNSKNDGRTLKAVRLTLTVICLMPMTFGTGVLTPKKDGLAGRVMARMRGQRYRVHSLRLSK